MNKVADTYKRETAVDEISELQDVYHSVAQRFAHGDRSAFAAWLNEAELMRRNEWLTGATDEATEHLQQLHGVAQMAASLYTNGDAINPLAKFCNDAEVGRWLATTMRLHEASAFRAVNPAAESVLGILAVLVLCMGVGKPGSVFDKEGAHRERR